MWLSGKRVVVTGVSSFIGTRTVAALCAVDCTDVFARPELRRAEAVVG
jgi:NAD(P)-dependent dehydrogenase (short-subunit alcohol dehydrogenase family)